MCGTGIRRLAPNTWFTIPDAILLSISQSIVNLHTYDYPGVNHLVSVQAFEELCGLSPIRVSRFGQSLTLIAAALLQRHYLFHVS